MPGPPPKRSDQRRRKNVVTVEKAASVPSVIPDGDPDWHPIAIRWFESLSASGQAVFYEASDWAAAYVVAESMSREFKPQPFSIGRGEDAYFELIPMPPKSASLVAWLKAMSSLLVTEGDRRRLRLELQKPEAEVDPDEARAVTELNDYRSRFAG